MKKLLLLLLVPAVAGAAYIIGGNSTVIGPPYYSVLTSMRTQMYVEHGKLPFCNIIKVEWYVHNNSEIKTGTFSTLKIILFESGHPEVQYNFGGSPLYYNIVEVYSRTNQVFNPKANTWIGFNFDKTYLYSRVALVIDVAWTSSGSVGCSTKCSSDTGSKYRILTYFNGRFSRYKNQHYLRITTGFVGVSPTSLGRIKALF